MAGRTLAHQGAVKTGDFEMNDPKQLEQLRQQLHDLQTQLAFQEDTISSLDAVVTRQQRQIDDLLAQWREQREQLDRLNTALDGGVVDSRPPHY